MSDVARPRLQFGIRTLLEIIAVTAFMLVILYRRPAADGANGRYQMAVGGSNGHSVIVLDGKTGKTWSRHIVGGNWQELPPQVPEFER